MIPSSRLNSMTACVYVIWCAVSLFISCNDRSTKPGDFQPPVSQNPKQNAIDIGAQWSPDGSGIIFVRCPMLNSDTTWAYGIFLHDLATGRDSILAPGERRVKYMDWSPDGRRIVMSVEGQVVVWNLETGAQTTITTALNNQAPRWSPCGNTIIFFARLPLTGLYTYDVTSQSLKHVESRNRCNTGDWMPDCSTLVVTDYQNSSDGDILLYSMETDSARLLVRTVGYKRVVAVSPDGKTILFTLDGEILSVDAQGRNIRHLTTEGGEHPSWSPDGKWIAFTKIDTANGYLWLMRPDGSEKHQLTFGDLP